MRGPCDGRCCNVIQMDKPRSELRRLANRGETEAALIWTLMRPVDPSDDVPWADHHCVALTSTGCALPREQRPLMCTDFPYGKFACHHCGAWSDAESRHVALMRRPS